MFAVVVGPMRILKPARGHGLARGIVPRVCHQGNSESSGLLNGEWTHACSQAGTVTGMMERSLLWESANRICREINSMRPLISPIAEAPLCFGAFDIALWYRFSCFHE
jgi:hypothetical protein